MKHASISSGILGNQFTYNVRGSVGRSFFQFHPVEETVRPGTRLVGWFKDKKEAQRKLPLCQILCHWHGAKLSYQDGPHPRGHVSTRSHLGWNSISFANHPDVIFSSQRGPPETLKLLTSTNGQRFVTDNFDFAPGRWSLCINSRK